MHNCHHYYTSYLDNIATASQSVLFLFLESGLCLQHTLRNSFWFSFFFSGPNPLNTKEKAWKAFPHHRLPWKAMDSSDQNMPSTRAAHNTIHVWYCTFWTISCDPQTSDNIHIALVQKPYLVWCKWHHSLLPQWPLCTAQALHKAHRCKCCKSYSGAISFGEKSQLINQKNI